MISLYTLLSVAGSAVVVPALYARSLGSPSRRRELPERLGRIAHFHGGSGAGAGGGDGGRAARVWLQAVSVGEVRAAEAILSAMRRERPALRVALSSTTEAGLEQARRLAAPAGAPGAAAAPLADAVFAFPLDLPWVVARALDAVGPSAYGSVETELWPAILLECARRGIPSFLVNGSVSERSAGRYRWMGRAFREAMASLRAACVQAEAEADRIAALGVRRDRIEVTGNVKFDAGRADLADRAEALRHALALPHGTRALVAGSTAPGEEAIVVEAWRRAAAEVPGLVLVVAPRHRERFDEAEAAMAAAGARVLRRSRSTGTRPPGPGEAILLDTIGELEAAYALAEAAFVGGSLVPRGGQSPIEPARAGVPVLFGPGMDSFREVAVALLARGGAFEVADAASLAVAAARLLTDPAARDRAARAARAFVEEHAGAAGRTLAALARLVPEVFA